VECQTPDSGREAIDRKTASLRGSEVAVMIRPAVESDVPVIRQLIAGLAEYEKLPLVVSEADLREHLFGPRRYAEVLLAEQDGLVVGFALFFHNYSTFAGKPGLYLEDLFVRPEARGQGHGKALMIELARIAVERECRRFEWTVLDWNTPAIKFYDSLGAVELKEWKIYRLMGDALAAAAQLRTG
jgi:GNAT superfamily N-acetyltransferase